MLFQDIIKKKRDGEELSSGEITSLVRSFAAGEIPDYQMTAFLMAVCWRGMSSHETACLTEALLASGKTLPADSAPGRRIDKHSTGGVGDKVSLVLAPLVASMGVRVPMISGRALGHTGGTLDKLESIPGFRSQLSVEEISSGMRDVGLVIAGETDELLPTERRLYALRGVTATVESVPLITASILSKKFVEGLDGLVLDVKTGSGAFMREIDAARALARSLVSIARATNKPVVAVITDMSQPLGAMVGNATELVEAVETLQGGGPEDLVRVTLELGFQMLRLAGLCDDREEAQLRLRKNLGDGSAMNKFVEMVMRQGGDAASLEDLTKYVSRNVRDVCSPVSGYIAGIDTYKMGLAAVVLGAGRKRLGDTIDHSTGYKVLARLGDRIDKGAPLAKVFYRDEASFSEAERLILEAYGISDSNVKPSVPRLIHEIITE